MWRIVRSMAALLALGALLAQPVEASWLSRILREAGEAGGGVATRKGLGAADNIAAQLKLFGPPSPKGAALGASASPEGHWTFVNLAGEKFTVGTPAEMQRIARILAPEAVDGKLTLLLADETIFRHRVHLQALPKGAELRVVVGQTNYPLIRNGAELLVELRPNVLVPMANPQLFRETVWQLGRPVEPSKIRVLALDPDGPQTLSPFVRHDPINKRAMNDIIDPYKLPDAMRAIPGQTVILTGRVDGRTLTFRSSGGKEQTLAIDDVVSAAGKYDVNVVVLQATSPRQPGERNWLWQRIQIAGLHAALRRPNSADFLNAIAETRSPLVITASERATGRVSLTARPRDAGQAPDAPTSTPNEGLVSSIVSNLTGEVITTAIDLELVSSERQRELDTRIVPGVPALLQYGYLTLLAIGMFGLPVSRNWWRRLWPLEQREAYRGRIGYVAARIVRVLAFVLVFMPVTSLPAALINAVQQIWYWVSLPFRGLRALFKRREPVPAPSADASAS